MDADQTQPRPDGILHLVAWVDQNRKRVIIGALGVLAVVLIAVAVISYQGQKEERASKALSSIRAPFSPTQTNPVDTAENYLKVAREYSGTKAGARALLLGGTALYSDGKYGEAQKTFDEFTRQYGDSPWLPQAIFGVASSLDAQGKANEAMAKYEELRRRFPNEAVMDETKLALARIYENQNRPADAFKLYDELVKANPYGGLGSEAGLRQAELAEKHPELAKANQPPVMSTTPTFTMTNQAARPATNRPAATNIVKLQPLTNTASRTQAVTLPPTGPTNSGAAKK
jgi:tetratricopeptide (TPR) repeat protein